MKKCDTLEAERTRGRLRKAWKEVVDKVRNDLHSQAMFDERKSNEGTAATAAVTGAQR